MFVLSSMCMFAAPHPCLSLSSLARLVLSSLVFRSSSLCATPCFIGSHLALMAYCCRSVFLLPPCKLALGSRSPESSLRASRPLCAVMLGCSFSSPRSSSFFLLGLRFVVVLLPERTRKRGATREREREKGESEEEKERRRRKRKRRRRRMRLRTRRS